MDSWWQETNVWLTVVGNDGVEHLGTLLSIQSKKNQREYI
jgi:hypothetical protein